MSSPTSTSPLSSRANAVNRTVLLLLAVLLLAAGVLGSVLAFGGFGADRARTPVLPDQLRAFADEHWWFWWAVAAGCVLLALLGLRWLFEQLRVDRPSRIDLTTDERDGLTTVHAGALTAAVEDEVERVRGVAGASAHLRGEHGRRLVLAVDLAEYADLAEVRRTLEERVVPHARQALDDPDLPVGIELRPGKRRTPRRRVD